MADDPESAVMDEIAGASKRGDPAQGSDGMRIGISRRRARSRTAKLRTEENEDRGSQRDGGGRPDRSSPDAGP